MGKIMEKYITIFLLNMEVRRLEKHISLNPVVLGFGNHAALGANLKSLQDRERLGATLGSKPTDWLQCHKIDGCIDLFCLAFC